MAREATRVWPWPSSSRGLRPGLGEAVVLLVYGALEAVEVGAEIERAGEEI